ncbi:hypothetical protein GCM10018777_23540 [Streptomyces albogriseolus]|uniref:hypothetical protein n=1 Tax=Streptomyces albogriseolus TaxID=1887 RepID=UPI001993C609|nr:hypothetical protein [Streptomyces viridodiastaticus]GHG10180.1 hypothetical protein GCM10018777_23540 [Streptomyces viridodiastaticus]
MSTEARRASLPPRPPHAPRTAGNPGPFDPRTPLDEQTDRPASEDTGRVVAPRPASDGPDTGAGGDDRAYRPSGTAGTDRVEAQRPGPGAPEASGDRGTSAGSATGDSTADHGTATPCASADARRPGAPRTERPHRPSGPATDSGTVGAQRPAPLAWHDGDPRGASPAEPTHPPTPPATGDARGAGTAERPYRPSGDGPTARPTTPAASEARRTGGAPAETAHGPTASDARRTGMAPSEPAYRPTASEARRTGAVSAEPTNRPTASDARRSGMAPAEPPYRPTGDSTPDREVTPPSAGARPRYPRIGGDAPDRSAPPPQASARFPDAPPTVGRGVSAPPGVGQRVSRTPPAPSAPPRPAHRPRTETPSETTTRLRPVPAGPDPALSWSAPMSPGGVPGAGRPAAVSFGEPKSRPWPFARRTRAQAVAAAVCLVLGTGLIGGAVTGAWLADGPEGPGTRHAFTVAGDLWHEVPVDQLFPPTVQGRGAGPGEADRVWTRIAVAPDSGCEGAFDALLTRALAPVGCERLLRATYTDATQSHVTTVGLLFTEADAAGMEALARRFDRERLDRRSDLMPLPYAAKDTAAEGFGPEQRASWAISVLTDAPVVVYAVSGWADGRRADEPQPAEDAMRSGATTAPAQAGLGHEARGLADRFERALRQRAGTPTERPS